MGKGVIFIVAYSIFIIGLFFTMCYLMTTVAPTPKTGSPITIEKGKDGGADKKGGASGRRKAQNGGLNYVRFEDQQEENSDEETLRQFIKEYSEAESRNQGKKQFVHRPNGKSTANLAIPSLPMPSPKIDIVLNNPSRTEYNRSSINALKQGNNTDLVFKIVDEDGYPRVEIKVNNKIKKIRKRKHLRVNATHNNVENKNKKQSEISKVIILKMFPNNTLSFEENNGISNDTAEAKETIDNKEKIKDDFVSYSGTNEYKSTKSVNVIAADSFTEKELNDTIISGLLGGNKYSQNVIRSISSVLDDSVAVLTEVAKDDVNNAA